MEQVNRITQVKQITTLDDVVSTIRARQAYIKEIDALTHMISFTKGAHKKDIYVFPDLSIIKLKNTIEKEFITNGLSECGIEIIFEVETDDGIVEVIEQMSIYDISLFYTMLNYTCSLITIDKVLEDQENSHKEKLKNIKNNTL